MRSAALLLLLASCAEVEPPSSEPPRWVYAPAHPSWQLGPLKGKLGRSQLPQAARELGVTGDAKVPLRDATPWSVPGEPARAAVFGFEGAVPAIELIEVDSGKHLWRHGTACVDPIIGVTETAIVCGGSKGVRGVGLDGKPKWQVTHPLLAMIGPRVVVKTGSEITVIDADTGGHITSVPLPPGVQRAGIAGACDGEIIGLTSDRLQRFMRGETKPVLSWQTPLTAKAPPPTLAPRIPPRVPPPPPPPPPSTIAIESITCGSETILVETRALEGPPARTLHAIARATGKQTGKVEQLRGWWPARANAAEVEVSAGGMVSRWPRDLSAPIEGLALPVVGELLDARDDRRLVRATPLTAVVLDRAGVRAYVPLATARAVVGKDAIVAAGLRRIAMPTKPERTTRVPPRRAGVALAAELRDLPVIGALEGRSIDKPETGKHAVAAIALDPREPTSLYVAALEQAPTATTTSPVARADLAGKTWVWQRSDGCGPGTPIGIALAAGIVVCGTGSNVRATGRDGGARWEQTLDVESIEGAGDAVLAFHRDRVTVLDAATGHVRGRLASGDGARVRAAILTVPIAERPTEDTTWLVTYEGGRLVARLPAVSMIAVWSIAVDGVVASIASSGEGVLVALDDGDAYRVELATAMVTPMPGLGLAWRAAGELVTGETIGGPIPGMPGRSAEGQPYTAPIRLPPRPVFARAPALSDRNPEAPDLWIPIPAPPSLGDSWQYTFYERTGAVRVRNDYALTRPIAPSAIRGPTGSPLVVASGPDLRDILVLDPRTGDPLRRVELPGPGFVFGTIVDGAPVAGTVLAAPLRIVLF